MRQFFWNSSFRTHAVAAEGTTVDGKTVRGGCKVFGAGRKAAALMVLASLLAPAEMWAQDASSPKHKTTHAASGAAKRKLSSSRASNSRASSRGSGKVAGRRARAGKASAKLRQAFVASTELRPMAQQ